jgi:hypothetical protein
VSVVICHVAVTTFRSLLELQSVDATIDELSPARDGSDRLTLGQRGDFSFQASDLMDAGDLLYRRPFLACRSAVMNLRGLKGILSLWPGISMK